MQSDMKTIFALAVLLAVVVGSIYMTFNSNGNISGYVTSTSELSHSSTGYELTIIISIAIVLVIWVFQKEMKKTMELKK